MALPFFKEKKGQEVSKGKVSVDKSVIADLLKKAEKEKEMEEEADAEEIKGPTSGIAGWNGPHEDFPLDAAGSMPRPASRRSGKGPGKQSQPLLSRSCECIAASALDR